VHKAKNARDQVAELYDDVTEKVEDPRSGVTGELAVGKRYIDKTKRGLSPPRPDTQIPSVA
jgi:hypothetical protein